MFWLNLFDTKDILTLNAFEYLPFNRMMPTVKCHCETIFQTKYHTDVILGFYTVYLPFLLFFSFGILLKSYASNKFF